MVWIFIPANPAFPAYGLSCYPLDSQSGVIAKDTPLSAGSLAEQRVSRWNFLVWKSPVLPAVFSGFFSLEGLGYVRGRRLGDNLSKKLEKRTHSSSEAYPQELLPSLHSLPFSQKVVSGKIHLLQIQAHAWRCSPGSRAFSPKWQKAPMQALVPIGS